MMPEVNRQTTVSRQFYHKILVCPRGVSGAKTLVFFRDDDFFVHIAICPPQSLRLTRRHTLIFLDFSLPTGVRLRQLENHKNTCYFVFFVKTCPFSRFFVANLCFSGGF